jgi:hypothetical protein
LHMEAVPKCTTFLFFFSENKMMCLLQWLPFLFLPIPLLSQSIYITTDYDTSLMASPMILMIPLFIMNFWFSQPTRPPCFYCTLLFTILVMSLCASRSYQCEYEVLKRQFDERKMDVGFGQFWIKQLIQSNDQSSCGCFGRREQWMDILGWWWCAWR